MLYSKSADMIELATGRFEGDGSVTDTYPEKKIEKEGIGHMRVSTSDSQLRWSAKI
jgi:hypothetical protein